ncbi:MAG: hypothetical protein M3367_03205 [Acidobacteriota bacterium]|nr:hypothetical protein [Acidobacteriota bacterium]
MSNLTQERIPIKTLRRYCSIAETHQDADDKACGMNNCLETRSSHALRLRRMVVCSLCEQGYFAKTDFDCHECFSEY